ncbi:MAG TPA: proton-conducting transporter membrane subunit [Candidatus Sulfotelmatobacter sp.]|nr:proton-conducting transporter membrane subunit [Candidatus Sulfotelmatobacter sp.]
MSTLSWLVVIVPGALAVATALLPSRAGRPLTAAGGLVAAALMLLDAFGAGRPALDALSGLFLIPVAVVYGGVGLYAAWYVAAESRDDAAGERYRRQFLALTNAFACAEAVVPLLSNMAGLWVAMEVTTILAALLVRLQGTDGALEAAWKYILIASCGLAIGLVGVVVLYDAGTSVLGAHYAPEWSAYVHAAKGLDPNAVRLAFLLALIGFGTKMGLAPMHTWLPDAHGAGPTPTSAMLSGVLLSDALYVILRFAGITNASVGDTMTHRLFGIVGIISLALAAFFLLQQRDIKRMLAYSSIEHMGVVAVGLAFGAPLAIAGALLHTINHAASKSLAFLSAGRLAERYETREIAGIRGGIRSLPVSGVLFALAGLSLAGLPPFGVFRSELMILAGGFGRTPWFAAIVAVLLTIAFAGLLRWVTATTTGDPPEHTRRGERALVPIAGMCIGLIVVIGLGLVVPEPLVALIARAQALFEGSP